ncbi:DUF4873 domain-containing protein [Pseudonocardia parietis]|uniref:DUF4873 domain-containing protein n=1 Tax=Pseudonocardia parietis TaxID=570936 RepID=A0ABS4W3J7_9PSEU|nr:DUF4873 domain-containing protein [Pseudonocardia parietis]MBP2370783.1 hypothetical protein [Pseudonocardia parietis]
MSGPEEGYRGPATLVVGGRTLDVEVLLDSRHEPFDGRLHWSGRVLAHPALGELLDAGGGAEIRTPGHTAVGTLSDPDPWGGLRIAGTGHPPFPVDGPPPPESD